MKIRYGYTGYDVCGFLHGLYFTMNCPKPNALHDGSDYCRHLPRRLGCFLAFRWREDSLFNTSAYSYSPHITLSSGRRLPYVPHKASALWRKLRKQVHVLADQREAQLNAGRDRKGALLVVHLLFYFLFFNLSQSGQLRQHIPKPL